jgi:hypothetical protein
MNDIPCAVSVAERLHDREPEGAAYWRRATDEIMENLVDYGQHPRNGRATVKAIELLPEDFVYRAFSELMLQSSAEGVYGEQERIKDAADVWMRPRLEEREYRWIVANLADDMARNAEADRWEDD